MSTFTCVFDILAKRCRHSDHRSQMTRLIFALSTSPGSCSAVAAYDSSTYLVSISSSNRLRYQLCYPEATRTGSEASRRSKSFAGSKSVDALSRFPLSSTDAVEDESMVMVD